MEFGLPDEESEQASIGTLLHAYDANPSLDRSFLKSEQQDLLAISKKLDDLIFARVSEQFALPEDESFEEGSEKELVALAGTSSETPGHADRWRFYTKRRLLVIIDGKMGYREVEPAAANYQLRTYAIGGSEEWDADNIVVAIKQPRLDYERRVTLAVYSLDDIEASEKELVAIRAAARKPDAPLHATESGCRYCRARAMCPEFAKVVHSGMALIPAPGLDVSKERRNSEIARSIAEASDDQVGKVLNSLQFAGFIADIVRDEARKRIAEDPEAGARMGWKLGKEIDKRNIVNVPRAVALLTLQGDLSRDEILNCSKPSLTKLQDKIRDKKKITHKAARAIVDETLEGTVEMEDKRPSLLRI